MDIEIVNKDTVWIRKARNHLWNVMKGRKIISVHSSIEKAKKALENMVLQ